MKFGSWFLTYIQDDVRDSLGRDGEDVEIALKARIEKTAVREGQKRWDAIKLEESKRTLSMHPRNPKLIYKVVLMYKVSPKKGVKK